MTISEVYCIKHVYCIISPLKLGKNCKYDRLHCALAVGVFFYSSTVAFYYLCMVAGLFRFVISFFCLFAWRYGAAPRRNNARRKDEITKWHKLATILMECFYIFYNIYIYSNHFATYILLLHSILFWQKLLPLSFLDNVDHLSQCMRFPTMWYVRPAKAQTSLRIRTV